MGLDMHLKRRKYVKNWNHTPDEKRFHGVAFIGNKPINLNNIQYLEFEAMYWRKMNAIHNWFVENVQDGKDDCGNYFVQREQIEKLLLTIDHVLQNKDDASKLLETKAGCFFGSTEIDDWYFDQLVETRIRLRDELNNNPDDEFYYESSW